MKYESNRPKLTKEDWARLTAEAEKNLPVKAMWEKLNLPPPLRIADNGSWETYVPWREVAGRSKRPSLRVFERGGSWWWKDMARDDAGRSLKLLARVKQTEPKHVILDFFGMAGIDLKGNGISQGKNAKSYPKVAAPAPIERPYELPPKPIPPQGLRLGTYRELEHLSNLRKGISVEALKIAQKMGLLRFGTYGGKSAWWTTDASGWVFQARRLDGKEWPAWKNMMEAKSRGLKGSKTSWPAGLANIGKKEIIAVVEGETDLLACIHFLKASNLIDVVAPVGILGVGHKLNDQFSKAAGVMDALKGKKVILFPDNDKAGRSGAEHWTKELEGIAAAVHVVDLGAVSRAINLPEEVKDLNDLVPHSFKFETWRLFGRFAPRPKLPVPKINYKGPSRAVSTRPERNTVREEVGASVIDDEPGAVAEEPEIFEEELGGFTASVAGPIRKTVWPKTLAEVHKVKTGHDLQSPDGRLLVFRGEDIEPWYLYYHAQGNVLQTAKEITRIINAHARGADITISNAPSNPPGFVRIDVIDGNIKRPSQSVIWCGERIGGAWKVGNETPTEDHSKDNGPKHVEQSRT